MLSQSDTPIYQVALQVDMTTTPTFTKAFKQKVGLSPGDYRKQCQGAF
ncbi:MAG: helix-turn-helix domain-containing protein [Streptococcus sp.]